MNDFTTLAAGQHGVITRAQLTAAGLDKDAIQRRLDDGRLVTLHSSVYALAGSPDTFDRKVRAAFFAAGPGAVISHRSAAALLGLGAAPTAIEVSVPRKRRPRFKTVTVYRVGLPRWHVVPGYGVKVTSRARTMCDLAGVLTRDELEATLDRALARRGVDLGEVELVLESLPRNAAGAGVLRALIAARAAGRARAESELEVALHRFLRRHRIRGWEPQLRIAGCRVDVGFVAEKLALQLDSFLHHSSRSDWALDHTRNAKLVQEGWRALPVTKEDLDEGKAFADRIRAALRAAAAPAALDVYSRRARVNVQSGASSRDTAAPGVHPGGSGSPHAAPGIDPDATR